MNEASCPFRLILSLALSIHPSDFIAGPLLFDFLLITFVLPGYSSNEMSINKTGNYELDEANQQIINKCGLLLFDAPIHNY